MNRDAVILRLMKEDAAGLAYCFNKMRWQNSPMYNWFTKKKKKRIEG